MIGSTSCWDYDAHNAHVEIGSTWLSRAQWGTSRNAETKLLLMTHAFEVLGLERIAFRTDIRNDRSQGAIEAARRDQREYIATRCADAMGAGETACTIRSCVASGLRREIVFRPESQRPAQGDANGQAALRLRPRRNPSTFGRGA